VEAIGHLLGLCRALASAFRVETAAIPADDLYARMLTQPLAGGPGRTVRQHVDDLAPLKVDHDRTVVTALLPALRWLSNGHAVGTFANIAQSSIPTTRNVGAPSRAPRWRLRPRRIVSSLCGSPRLAIRRSAGRPAAACPISLVRSATRQVRRADGRATWSSRSLKV
jgi:hypothetical protein